MTLRPILMTVLVAATVGGAGAVEAKPQRSHYKGVVASVESYHHEFSARRKVKKTRQAMAHRQQMPVASQFVYDHGISYTGDAYARAVPATRAGRSQVVRGGGGGGVIERARSYIGMTASQIGLRTTLWCAAFMNHVLGGGTGSNLAKSYASYGTRISGPQVGAIAVMSRGRTGGHVGIVSGIDSSGNPILISGNSGGRKGLRTVSEHAYPRGRIYAYVMP